MRYLKAIDAICPELTHEGGNGRQQAAGTRLVAGKALPLGCRAYSEPRNWVILY
jgi:hypothetical protein